LAQGTSPRAIRQKMQFSLMLASIRCHQTAY